MFRWVLKVSMVLIGTSKVNYTSYQRKTQQISLIITYILGNDDVSSVYNEFSVACLDLMGRFSQLAKAKGYLVTMAPAGKAKQPTNNQIELNTLTLNLSPHRILFRST